MDDSGSRNDGEPPIDLVSSDDEAPRDHKSKRRRRTRVRSTRIEGLLTNFDVYEGVQLLLRGDIHLSGWKLRMSYI